MDQTARVGRLYDGYAPRYDREVDLYDRVMLGAGRSWVGAQAHGRVLEVAFGTGRNLAFYRPDVFVVGVELSTGMLAHARPRLRAARVPVHVLRADAQRLPLRTAAFDTVVCTLALSSIPDERCALAEMHRVLRPGGSLLLLGHVASPLAPVRGVQRLVERLSLRLAGDHQTRRILPLVIETGFEVRERQLSRAGVIERIHAAKRLTPASPAR